MNWLRLLVLIFTVGCAAVGDRGRGIEVGAPAGTPEIDLRDEGWVQLSAQVEDWADDGQVVGAELLVMRDGAVLLHDAYGWSDREEQRELERGSIYRIRSMTKPFIGTATLKLVAEGKLGLDDPIARNLSSFDHDGGRQITVRQLLTHSSGLEGLAEMFAAADRSPEQSEVFREGLGSLRDLVDEVGEVGVTGTPGEYRYSDLGSAALAAVVAEVAGMPVERFLKLHVFEPLGLRDTHTSYSTEVPWREQMNSTYEWNRKQGGFDRYWDPSQPQEARFFRGSGGMYSTAMDVARFAHAWLSWTEADGLLPRELAREALQPQADRTLTEGYGYQWTVSKDLSGGLPRLFGHGGSDGTRLWVFPETRTIVVYLSQSRDHSMRSEFVSLMARELPWASFLGEEQEREAEILSAVDAFLRSLCDLDLDRLREHFAQEASVFFPVEGESARADGWSRIKEVFGPVFEEWREELDGPPYPTIEPRDMRIQWIGESALVTFHIGRSGRRTLALEKRNGEWKVVHLHGS